MQAKPLVVHQIGDEVLIDDNFGSWLNGIVTAVLENGQAYSAKMKDSNIQRSFVPCDKIKPLQEEGGSNEQQHHDWDSLRVAVDQALEFLGRATVESRQQHRQQQRSKKDVLTYFQERFKHYDLIQDGWIRHKEFHRAIEDVYGSYFPKNQKEGESTSNAATLEETCEALYPFLDPEGRGHCEYHILIQHIKAHVSNIASLDRTKINQLQMKLKHMVSQHKSMEDKARSHWTHQPALMVASWSSMYEFVFSGCPDHVYSTLSAATRGESISVTLDAEAMYGQPSFTQNASLSESWRNMNLSPKRKSENKKLTMHYVPKWSSKMFGLYATNAKRNPTQDHWNGMPVLALNALAGAGLKIKSEEETFINGVTWGHLLAGLWYQRRDVLVHLSSEYRMLSNKTCAALERAARIDDMSHRRSNSLMHASQKRKNNNRTQNKKKNRKQTTNDTEEDKDQQLPGVDFITRMDRKLRATRIKLEQQRQATYKKDRDAAVHTDKTWDQVEKAFFKRLNVSASPTQRTKEEQHDHKIQRMMRTSGGKTALHLQRRSANGFNALCRNASQAFQMFDTDSSGFIEVSDLEKLLHQIKYVPPSLSGVDGAMNWLESATRQLDRNEDGAICWNDFIAWWTSQCPTCIPLRGCYPEINIDVRRVALDKNAAQWMSNEKQNLHYVMKDYTQWSNRKEKSTTAAKSIQGERIKAAQEEQVQIPMVCVSCWAEYKRATFVAEYDDRNDHMKRLEKIRVSAARGSAAAAAKALGGNRR